jgi:hypothetical protein
MCEFSPNEEIGTITFLHDVAPHCEGFTYRSGRSSTLTISRRRRSIAAALNAPVVLVHLVESENRLVR